MTLFPLLNWINGTYWRLEYAEFMLWKGNSKQAALHFAKHLDEEFYYEWQMTKNLDDSWAEFVRTEEYRAIQITRKQILFFITVLSTSIILIYHLINYLR